MGQTEAMGYSVMYSVCKDPLTKFTCYQFIVPDSLVSEVSCGIHYEAGHQGQGTM